MTSVTPDSRKVGTGMAASPSPFLTPRPEKRRGTLDWNSNHKDKDKEVNVQVVLRCRVYHMKCFRISKQPLLLPHQLIQNSNFCKNQNLTGIKGLSEVKVDKICEAADKSR